MKCSNILVFITFQKETSPLFDFGMIPAPQSPVHSETKCLDPGNGLSVGFFSTRYSHISGKGEVYLSPLSDDKQSELIFT